MEYVSNAILILSFIITVATFYIKQKRDKRADEEKQKKARADEMANIRTAFEELQKNLDARLDSLNLKHEKDIAALRESMISRDQELYDKMDRKRSDEMKRVHERLDTFEKQYAAEVMERIGAVEAMVSAKMESIEKTLAVLQNSLMAK